MALNLEQASGLNAVFAVATAGAALTGISGAATTYSTSAFGFAINGVLGAKALVSGGATPTLDGNSGLSMSLVANQAAAFVWCINGAGTISVVKGPTTAWTNTTAGSTPVTLPSLPSGSVAFAYHVVQAGATTVGTWTFGSSNWNATGITAGTVVNVAQLPNSGVLTA